MLLTESIDSLRVLFEEELATNPSAYHEIDIERVRTEEWQVKRFLLEHQPDQQKAFEEMCKSLKWKHSFGVHERTDQHFPKEIWTLNGMEMTGEDRDGRLIVWASSRNARKFKELTSLMQQFTAHRMERADRLAGDRGCVMVGDCTGVSPLNTDLKVARFSLELINYYPLLIKASYMVNLPPMLHSLMKVLLGLLNAKHQTLTHFVSEDKLVDVIELEHIPERLNGKRQGEVYPENLVPLEERFQELGLDLKFVNHYYKTLDLTKKSQ